MPITRADLTRELDLTEKIFLFCERRQIFSCISISIEINKPLTEDAVFSSLRKLVLKYPLLFSFPVGEESQARLEPLEKILFADVYEVNESITKLFKDVDNEQENRALSMTSLYENHQQKTALWKLVYYKHTNWLSFHISHSFTDGGSVVAYLKEFVEQLNHVTDSKAEKVLFSLEEDLPKLTRGISPGLFETTQWQPNDATKFRAATLKLVMEAWPSVVPSILKQEWQNLYFVGRSPEPQFESEHVMDEHSPLMNALPYFVNFDIATSRRLNQACRENGVNFLAFLTVVYAHTVLQISPGLYDDLFLKVGIAVSLRNLFNQLQSHNKYLGNEGRFEDGCYSYAVGFSLDPGTNFSWEAVRKYQKILFEAATSEDLRNEYYMGCKVLLGERFVSGKFQKRGNPYFLFHTSLGHMKVIDHGDSDAYQILDILFAPSAGALLSTHMLSTSSTEKGGLNIGFLDADRRITDWALFKKTFSAYILDLLGVKVTGKELCGRKSRL